MQYLAVFRSFSTMTLWLATYLHLPITCLCYVMKPVYDNLGFISLVHLIMIYVSEMSIVSFKPARIHVTVSRDIACDCSWPGGVSVPTSLLHHLWYMIESCMTILLVNNNNTIKPLFTPAMVFSVSELNSATFLHPEKVYHILVRICLILKPQFT